MNTLPLRVRFAGVSTLDELHAAVQHDLLYLAEMQDVPFDSLVSALNFNRLSSTNFLQATLNFKDVPEGNLGERAKFSGVQFNNSAAHMGLVCFIELRKDGSLRGE